MTSFIEQQQQPAWANHHHQQPIHKQNKSIVSVASMAALAPSQQQAILSTTTVSQNDPGTCTNNETPDTPQQPLQSDQQQSQQQQAPVRKRTRATADQLSVLEDTFAVNVSPNSKLRKQLAEQLNMSERSIQIWFQNRRAKVKHMQKRAQMQMHQATLRAQLYHQQQQQYSNYYMNGYYYPYSSPNHLAQPPHQRHNYSYSYPYQQHQNDCNNPAVAVPSHQQQPAIPAAMPMARAQSVDGIVLQQQHRQRSYHTPIYPHPASHSSSATPPLINTSQPIIAPATALSQQPSWKDNELQTMSLSRQSMPPQMYDTFMGLDFPEYIGTPTPPPPTTLTTTITSTGSTVNDSNIPTLISVPDAGPTAMLTTSTLKQSSMPPLSSSVDRDNASEGFASSLLRSSSTPETMLPTIDPSTLLMKSAAGTTTVEDAIMSTDEDTMPALPKFNTPADNKARNVKTEETQSEEKTQFEERSNSIAVEASPKKPEADKEELKMIKVQKPEEAHNGSNQANTTQEEEEEEQPKDLYFSANTLTVGTWHRLKNLMQTVNPAISHPNAMQTTADLVCVYCPDKKLFAWHIIDSGCHFKMEVSQEAISSIEFITVDQHHPQQHPQGVIAQVHFDISEPPLFYMESSVPQQQQQQQQKHDSVPADQQRKSKKKKLTSANHSDGQPVEITTVSSTPFEELSMTTTAATASASSTTPVWVQCSDFTEGKQASRYFRHTIQGDAYHLRQELMALINNHEETRRYVHFIDGTSPGSSIAVNSHQPTPVAFVCSQQQQQQPTYIIEPQQQTDFYPPTSASFYNGGMLLDGGNSALPDYQPDMMELMVNTPSATVAAYNNPHNDAMLGYWADASLSNACEMYMR